MADPIRVLFVCLGNICRSPLAEAVFRHQVRERGLADRFDIDSAGTSGYHRGSPPDRRSTETARRRGIELTGRSRSVVTDDLRRFDYVIAMDAENEAELRDLLRASGGSSRVHRLREWDPQPGDGDVPDPYYGGPRGFDDVHDIVERASAAFLDAPSGLFAAEARGLEALRAAADGIAVPRALAWAEAEEPAWLALEWLEPGRRAPDFAERLGRGLAAIHRVGQGEGWGWMEDNFIGPLPQANAPAASWAEFWRARRLEPQLALARSHGRLPGKAGEWERLLDRLPDLLAPAEADGSSLLHGDLWSGNVLAAAGGPALIDPAVYRGHREADLAMTELFGGFGAGFYDAYREAWPPQPGYPLRRAVYQLWYLLIHVNLFGGGYGAQAAGVLREVLAG